MSLHIHLGAHKTATTYLQKSIRRIEPELLARDILYLSPETTRSHLVSGLLQYIDKDPEVVRQNGRVPHFFQNLMAEHRHCLITEELILGGLNRDYLFGSEGVIYKNAHRRVNNLLKLFGTTDATLFLSVRSPATYLTSVFGEQLRQGGHLLPHEYLGDYGPLKLRWSHLVQRLLDTGVSRVVCWRFEDMAAVREKLLDQMVGPDVARVIPQMNTVRAGLSQAAYEAVLDADPGEAGKARKLLVDQCVEKFPKGPGVKGIRIFDEGLHNQSDIAYAQDCDVIAALHGVQFLWPARN